MSVFQHSNNTLSVIKASLKSVDRACDFGYERELVHVVEKTISDLLCSSPYLCIRREWPFGYRIADIAMGEFEDDTNTHLIHRSIERISSFGLRIMAELLPRPLKPATISRRLYTTHTNVEKELANLESKGIVKITPGGAYQAAEWRTCLPKRLIAVEAKLTDWKEAVHQAAYYKDFTSYSYVAMPDQFRCHTDLLASCKNFGLGLIVTNTYGLTRVILQPTVQKKKTTMQVMSSLQMLQHHIRKA